MHRAYELCTSAPALLFLRLNRTESVFYVVI